MSDMWNDRLRLIRFRRKHERTKFREELRIIPRWLVRTCIIVWLIAIAIAYGVALFLELHPSTTTTCSTMATISRPPAWLIILCSPAWLWLE